MYGPYGLRNSWTDFDEIFRQSSDLKFIMNKLNMSCTP